jgi:hypothetical protein
MNWVVYVLKDPRTNAVRYVGWTAIDPALRLHRHIKDSRRKTAYRSSAWIVSLTRAGFDPQIEVIEQGVGSAWKEAERRWIAFYRANGNRLTNLTDGGEGSPGYKHTRTKEEWAASFKKREAAKTAEERSANAKKWLRGKTPDQLSAIAKKRDANMSAEQLSARAKKAAVTKGPERRSAAAAAGVKGNANRTVEQNRERTRKRQAEKTPEERSEIARKRQMAKSPEQRRSDASRAAIAANKIRWANYRAQAVPPAG